MFLVRKLSHVLAGSSETPFEELRNAGVPVTPDDCRTCPTPCDEGHEDYNFKVDLRSNMRGRIRTYRRMALISTGMADWPMYIHAEDNTLTKYLAAADGHFPKKIKRDATKSPVHNADSESESEGEQPTSNHLNSTNSKLPSGVARSNDTTRLTILNSSHKSFSQDTSLQSVIILPDYKVVSDIPASQDGAERLWKTALDPNVGQAGAIDLETKPALKTWHLPYDCLILLCSHKKVDNRCHLASIALEAAFTNVLEAEGWHVDTNLEDLSATETPLEAFAGNSDELEHEMHRRLKTIGQDFHRALILKISHIGGHKYAGNVIINFPQGSSLWYGRVSVHEVSSIVKNTILQGKVLPDLLRGGMNIARHHGKCLIDW